MLQIHIVYCGVNWLLKFTRWEGCKYSINQVWYAEYQPWNYITFHFSKIGKMVRNQICLDTHTNMYLVAKYTNAVFSLYTVGYVKIQVWESRKIHVWGKENPSMLTSCQNIQIRFCLLPNMMFSPKFGKSMFSILKVQIGMKTKSMFGKLVLFPCLEKLIVNFHTKSIQHRYEIPTGKFANFSIL